MIVSLNAYHALQHRSEIAAMLTDAGHSPGDLDTVGAKLSSRRAVGH